MTCESIKCYNDWLLMLKLEVYDGDLMNAVLKFSHAILKYFIWKWFLFIIILKSKQGKNFIKMLISFFKFGFNFYILNFRFF